MKHFTTLVSMAILLLGCASNTANTGAMSSGEVRAVPAETLKKADFGAPPPRNYREIIKTEFAKILIDPTSPIYEFEGEPSKGYTRNEQIFNAPDAFGWKVCGKINSKNRMGGYTGAAPFFVLFRDRQIVFKIVGDVPLNEYGINIANEAIGIACTRQI